MNENVIKGTIDAIFVMGGISPKSKNLYLQVSDGISAEFISIPKNSEFPDNIFEKYERGDTITLELSVSPFSKRATLLNVL